MRFKEVILPSVTFFTAVLASLMVLAVGLLLASLRHPGALPLSQQPTLSRFFLTHNGLLRKLIISGILCSGLGSPLTVLLLLKSETPSAGRFRFRDQVRGVLPLLGIVLLLITVGAGGMIRALRFGLSSFRAWYNETCNEKSEKRNRRENLTTLTPAPPVHDGDASPPAASHETIEFIKKGQLTIPKRIRDAYHIEPGQKGTLIELGGALLILPRRSEIPALFDEVREGLETSEMSLEEMVLEMRRVRESSDYEGKA